MIRDFEHYVAVIRALYRDEGRPPPTTLHLTHGWREYRAAMRRGEPH